MLLCCSGRRCHLKDAPCITFPSILSHPGKYKVRLPLLQYFFSSVGWARYVLFTSTNLSSYLAWLVSYGTIPYTRKVENRHPGNVHIFFTRCNVEKQYLSDHSRRKAYPLKNTKTGHVFTNYFGSTILSDWTIITSNCRGLGHLLDFFGNYPTITKRT